MDKFKIEAPKLGDEMEIAPMHIQSWKETYVPQSPELTNEMVDEWLGHMLTDTSFRRKTIEESIEHPERVLYRVVRSNAGSIVGFLHGSKSEEFNELEAIYLLNEAKGSGTGGKLMQEFLAWADKGKPSKLEVFAFNDSALDFYTKYGFVKTNKPPQLYKDVLPYVEMVRPTESI